MARQGSTREKLYLYAIAPGSDCRIFGPIGLDGGTVYSITNGGVSAVVSDVPEKIRPERRHLAAHQAVLKRLMLEADAVLPVAFGVVADSPDAIRMLLSRNKAGLTDNLRYLIRRIEMGLQVTWDVPNIFEYFVATHPQLGLARDRFFSGHRQPSQDDKIELGRLFDRLLLEDREVQTARVEAVLAPHCVEIKRSKLRNEREVANLACLVERHRQGKFEAAVFEAAKFFDNGYAFDYSGPWAPHNFVDMALDLRPARTPAQARL